MPIVPLHGHRGLTERLTAAIHADHLPQSLLLHGDPRIGKQRVALWLARALLCERGAPGCGSCQHCRYSDELTHPDLIWAFPRPRLKDSDASPDDVKEDLAAAIGARVATQCLYTAPSGSEGIYVPTIRMIVRWASTTPAMARRKVIIVGDAERMVSQEGADQAANAFLKLLEEPGPATRVILTSSAPGALLPTIRSRLVAFRVSRLSNAEVDSWIAEEPVLAALQARNLPGGRSQWVDLAAGAPGRLLNSGASATATETARRLVATVATSDRERETRAALAQGSAGARGAFSEVLDAVALELRASMSAALNGGDERLARALAHCIERVEDARILTQSNGNPQLISAGLLSSVREAMSAAGR